MKTSRPSPAEPRVVCTHYRAPDEDPGISELRIGIGDLFRREPWQPDVYPDYAAPIARADGDGLAVVSAVFGFWPKFMQPERLDEHGRKRKKLDTVNARDVEVARRLLILLPAGALVAAPDQAAPAGT